MSTIDPDTEHPSDQRTPAENRRRWWALGFILAGNLAVFAAVTMMNVALPQAQEELGFSDAAGAAVVTLYSLCFGAFMLLGGRLADVFGLRRCLATGLVGFAAASLIGGLAPTGEILLIARGLQGLSGALVAATALAMISVMFTHGPDRTRAFAVLGMVMGMGTAASFTLAGALVDGVSWQWVMLINVPLALVVAFGLVRTAPATPTTGHSNLGLGSALLVTAALGLLVFGFDRTSALGWSHPSAWGPLIGAVVLFTAFTVTLRRSAQPLIPLRLLADRHRITALTAVFVVGIGMFAGMFILTTFLQGILDYSALETGLAFLPFGVSAIATSQMIAALSRRVSTGVMLFSGLFLMAVATASFMLLGSDSTYLTGVLPAMLLLGAGGTIVMITGANAATLGAGADSGIASALVNSGQQIGAALGTALLTAIMTATTRHHLAQSDELTATLAGYRTASGVGAGILVVSAVAVLLLGRASHRR
ncbi:sugar phosphate permease [Stackebrandtia endophytica]|uniref:Sugar phosphate permease n=1 Tax=Stackebrandtia endophytica TaxID=1496996 RepID=A0A543ASM4_9ACTN|nr:MFS transporter [Stackebrandtia endophytica]TQL75582.1 sugar phosphate permease [Stackebrandtia endophytica]